MSVAAAEALTRVVAVSPAMKEVLGIASRLAAVTSPVLVTGESGTGKDLLAHFIHYRGPRRDGPLLKIHCPSIPEDLLEVCEIEGAKRWQRILYVVLPLLTPSTVVVIALSYANLLEGSVLTETVFAWPGIGSYITNSLLNADMNAVLGGTIVIGITFVGVNLLSDLLYRVLDPRAR